MQSVLVKALTSRPLVIFTGAGISFDSPTALPLGMELTEWFIKRILPIDVKSLVDNASLRPEVIMQVLWEFLGNSIFHSLRPFSSRPPNRFHWFLAELSNYDKFRAIVTTNLDTCHERAIRSLSSTPIIHLHGRADDTDSVKYALDQVSNKKAGIATKKLKSLFSGCTVIFLGYSGCDDFDISPALRSLSDDIYFVWIDHIVGMDDWKMSAPKKTSSSYSILSQRSANNMHYIYGDTWAFCQLLAALFNIEEKYLLISQKYHPSNFDLPSIKRKVEDSIISGLAPPKKEVSGLISAEILFRFINNYEIAKQVVGRIDSSNFTKFELRSYYRILGFIEYRCGNLIEAEKSFQRAMKCGARKSFMKRCLGDVAYRRNQFSLAENLLKEAIEASRYSEKEQRDKGQALASYALVLQDIGKREEAISLYNKAGEIFDAEGDIYSLSDILNNKGIIFQESLRLEDALHELYQSLEIRRQIHHLQGICYSLLNIGLVTRTQFCMSHEKKYLKKAHKYFQEALAILPQKDVSFDRGLVLKNIGDLFLDTLEVSQAKSALLEAYNIFSFLSGQEGLQFSCLLSIFELYLLSSNNDEIICTISKLKNLAKSEQLEEKKLWYNLLTDSMEYGFNSAKIISLPFHPVYIYRYDQLCGK